MQKKCKRLTPEDLAFRWGCSTKKLANARVDGKGPEYIKTGKGRNAAVVYRLKDILTWERENRFKNTSEEKERRNHVL